MSLLQQLQKKRSALKTTTTIVTTATGARYIEGTSEILSQSNYGFVLDTKPDPEPACIIADFLYLGSQDAVCLKNVNDYRLTHILSVGIETPNVELPTKIQCHFLPCLDLPETKLFDVVLPNAIKIIESVKATNGRILVHCNAGVSRSASVVIGYLMLKRNMNFEQAYDLVKQRRECIQPNTGFREQLRSYCG